MKSNDAERFPRPRNRKSDPPNERFEVLRGSRSGENVMSIWTGTPPTQCEVCSCSLIRCGEFIDGKTKMGPWALMCPGCHKRHGGGLGSGKGQKYVRKERMTEDGAPEVVWEKVNP